MAGQGRGLQVCKVHGLYRLADALAAEADAARARLDEAYAQLRAVRSEGKALEPAVAAAAARLANLQAEAEGVRAAMRALGADKARAAWPNALYVCMYLYHGLTWTHGSDAYFRVPSRLRSCHSS